MLTTIIQLKRFLRVAVLGIISLSLPSAFALKVGVIEIATLISQSPNVKAFYANLEAKAEMQKEVVQKKRQEYEQVKSEFEKNAMLMEASTRNSKAAEIKKLEKSYESAINELRNVVTNGNMHVQQIMDDLGVQVAKENKLDILFGEQGILYSNPNLDYTQKAAVILKKDNRLKV